MSFHHHHLSSGLSPGALSDLTDDDVDVNNVTDGVQAKVELTEDNVDLSVDVDSEIEESLDAEYLSEESEEGDASNVLLNPSATEESLAREYEARIEEGASFTYSSSICAKLVFLSISAISVDRGRDGGNEAPSPRER